MRNILIRSLSIAFILELFLITAVHAQENSQFGTIPSLNLRKSFSNDWKLNFQLASRQQFSKNQSNVKMGYDYLLTDISMIAAKKTGLNNAFASGYLVRLENGDASHRFIEQFSIVSRYNGFRLSHRFRADLTLNRTKSPETRLRYRITPEIPLSGLAVDENEFYTKISNEYVISFQSNEQDLEIRLVPSLGYRFDKSNRLEVGLDSRIDSFLNNNTRKRFWLVFNWYATL